jgi:YesN/AraC family two-component response regulator
MTLPQSHNSFSLLIVEDDKAAREVTARMVTGRFPNCTIYTADNGIEGKAFFKQCSPDIVLTDVNMPVMDGVEMILGIRSINADAAFIVLTAYSDKNTLEKFQNIGVRAYLLKPLDFNELFAAIEKCRAAIEPPPE